MTTPTVQEVLEMTERKELHHHHTASTRGYLSRKSGGVVAPYKGKFGEGYTISTPRFDTTRYIDVAYYVK